MLPQAELNQTLTLAGCVCLVASEQKHLLTLFHQWVPRASQVSWKGWNGWVFSSLSCAFLGHCVTVSSRVSASPEEDDQSLRCLSASEIQKSTTTEKAGNDLTKDGVPWGQVWIAVLIGITGEYLTKKQGESKANLKTGRRYSHRKESFLGVCVRERERQTDRNRDTERQRLTLGTANDKTRWGKRAEVCCVKKSILQMLRDGVTP